MHGVKESQPAMRKRAWLIWPVILFLAVVGHTKAFSNDVSLSAALSTTSLSLDSTAFLTITVYGARSAEIDVPEIENLLLQRRGQSSKMQVINGEISSSVTYTFLVTPMTEGTFTIPSLGVRVKNILLQTDPLLLEVVAESQGDANVPDTQSNTKDQQLAFLTVTGLHEKAYSGQIIPIEIKAYFRRGIRVEIQNLPSVIGEAFVLSPLSKEPRQTTEPFGGTMYSVISWNSTVSPIKVGNHEFSLNLDATLLLPQKNTRSQRRPQLFGDDFFDDEFFNGFFGGIEKKKVNLSSPKLTTAILALPEQGKPADFSGAVGEFEIEMKAHPLKIEVGDPITLTISISGKGNFDRVTAPLFTGSPDWKTYSPSSRFESSGYDYEGKKVFEQAIVAKSGAVEAIPSLKFSYFDPRKEAYITKNTETLPLTIMQQQVKAGNQADQLTSTGSAPDLPAPQNVNSLPAMPIKLTSGNFVADIVPLFERVWFIVMTLTTSLLLLGVLVTFLLKNYREKNKGLLARKKLKKQLSAVLNSMEKSISTRNGDQFITALRQVIQQRLAYLWDVEPSAITLRDLQKRLPGNSPLIHIFLVAEEHAYGGATLTAEDMQNYFDTLKKEVETEL